MRALAAMAAGLALLLTGCGAPSAGAGGGEAGGDVAALRVATTVYPLGWVAEQVAPEAAHTLLGARGQDPHDLELSPGERALLAEADVVLYLGQLGFQPQVEAGLADRAGATVDVHALLGENGLRPAGARADDPHPEHDAGADERYDPHVWFDAAAMAQVAQAAGEAFARADPAGADGYRARAGALRDQLLALDAELDALLAGCAHDTAIVSHEAFAYLLEPRGLAQEGVSGAGGHGEASPRRLAELAERIRTQAIPAVLAEPVEGREDAQALAREAGVPLLEVDPLEAPGEDAALGYPELLRRQAAAFAEALACG